MIVDIFPDVTFQLIPNDLGTFTCNAIYLKVFQYSYATLAGDLKQTPPTSAQGILNLFILNRAS